MISLLLLAGALPPPPPPDAGEANPETIQQEVEQAIRDRIDLELNALDDDPRALAQIQSDPFWYITESGRFQLSHSASSAKALRSNAEQATHLAQRKEVGLSYDPPSELAIRVLGPDLVMANYRLVQHTRFQGEPCTKVFRMGEVFRRESGRWKSMSLQETLIPGEPVRYPVDPTALDAYPGSYRLLSAMTFRVSRDKERLLLGINDGKPVELVPEDEHTFVINARNRYRVRFDRGPSGKVSRMRFIEAPGVEYSALKQ